MFPGTSFEIHPVKSEIMYVISNITVSGKDEGQTLPSGVLTRHDEEVISDGRFYTIGPDSREKKF